ncbi:type I glyceraldehyde-3-phosphate dehydrogenase [Paenibacillus sp. GD4]|uniref:type I glyceraldehyde-3-phosphate dehydrogenase n=1 Tax=Paenibacillus sp. GD4 TaxID=3068890 RepID=UPI0027966BAC|nr:type I glyceraldehyde-3-phosphate dehydrogenase [Paenibacillus sp. GD4]MDQ1913556.1 type I glyceraldehyde-3-phosphate dehydrogenase [Paenibacillus sp. GD4]
MNGIGVSGMGRIGRLIIRKLIMSELGSRNLQLKAINSIYPIETIAHLLKYDSVHGIWDIPIFIDNNKLILDGHAIEVALERDPENIPWTNLGVNLVIDATGKFNYRAGAQKHLNAGASHVIITSPGEDMDFTVVMGVNDHLYDSTKHKIVSAASCTTNCLAPVLNILDRAFQVKYGWMTTVHSFTSDQMHLDNPHMDLRRARACTQSIVPTTTGVGKALIDVLPHLAKKIHGLSIRVPTQDVSLIDLTVKVSKNVSKDEVKKAILEFASPSSSSYIGYTEEPLVSIDFVGNEFSAVIDGISMMVEGDQIKLLAWYDNEWGYSCRVVDVALMVLTTLE